jgi:hypothetical protein
VSADRTRAIALAVVGNLVAIASVNLALWVADSPWRFGWYR